MTTLQRGALWVLVVASGTVGQGGAIGPNASDPGGALNLSFDSLIGTPGGEKGAFDGTAAAGYKGFPNSEHFRPVAQIHFWRTIAREL